MCLLPGALLALLAGPTPGLAGLLVGALGLVYHHLRGIRALVEWARTPLGTSVPPASGLWDLVFAEISRRTRLMRDQRERLSSALDRFVEAGQAMPDGVIYLGSGSVIDWANHRAEAHFGIDAVRDIGAPMGNLVRDPAFADYLDAGDYSEPLVMKPLRQPELTLLIQFVPYADHKTMLLSRDISQLERLETMRRDFVANVSHELRTPLTVVRGFLETLSDGIDDLPREARQHYLALASEQAARMQRLIQDLLVLSALETGAPAPTEERVDIPALLAAVLREGQALSAGRHTITLELECRDVVRGSSKELHSAFANLLTNAVRYGGEGGPIALCWRTVGEDRELSVADRGIGIEAVHIPRLTERFYRVDRGRSRESGGTGLGLAIVKHVVTRHQGRLIIESTPGKGSTFRVRLPRQRVLTSTAAAEASPRPDRNSSHSTSTS